VNFFPEPNSPELAPFTQAFMHMMFAHVEFERRVAELAEVISLDPKFGETKAIAWSAKERPQKFSKLCANNQDKHPGGLPEGDAIVRYLDEAFALCKDRNWLTHGVWWRFDTDLGVLDVHTVRVQHNEPLSRQFTIEQIQRLAESFKDIEVELWKLQRAIVARSPHEPLPSTSLG
jgi:hypothetical protein